MDIFKTEQLRKTLSERMQGIPDSATFQRDMLDDNKRFNLFETVRKSNIFKEFPADYRTFKASLGITEEDITQEQRLFDLNTVVEIGNEQKRAKAEEAASRPNVQGQFSEQIRAAAQRDAAQPLAGAPMPEKTNVQEFGKELQRQGVKPTEQSLVRRVGPQVAFERMKTMGEWTDEDVIKNTLPPDVDYNTATTLVPYIRRIFQDEESLNRRFNDPNFDQYEQAEQIGNMIGKEVENVQSRLSHGARSVLSGGKQDQFEQALQIYSEAGRLGNTMVGRDKSLELYDYFKNNFDDDVIEAVYYIEQRNRLVRDFEAVFKAFPDVRARTEKIKARLDRNNAALDEVNPYARYMNSPNTSIEGIISGWSPVVDASADFVGNIAVSLKELTQRGLRNMGVNLNEYTAVDKVFDSIGDYYNENIRMYRPTNIFDENGNFTADNLDAAIASQVINLVGISKLGQGAAWASSKMLGRGAAAAAGGARVGQFMTSYMLTYGDYVNQAIDMGLSSDQAGELAAQASGALAFVETVAVGEKLLGAVKPNSFRNAVEAAMRGDIKFRDVGKFMLKETPMEVFEEELALLAESAIHTVFNEKYGTDFDTEITGEDIVETAALTAAATNIVFGLSATGAITNQRIADLEYLSQNLDKFEDYLEEGLATGKITEQQANDAWAKVAEATSAREKANQLTGGKRATDPRIQQAQDLLDDDDLGGFDNFFGETMDGYNYSAQEGLLNIISSFPGAASGEGEGSAVRLLVDNFIEERRSIIKEDRDLAERFKNKEISQSEYKKATNDLINRAKSVAKKFNNEVSALADSSMDAALQASGITDPVERDQSIRDFKRNAQMVSDMAIAEIDLAYTANRSNYRQFAKKMVRPALSRIQDIPKDEDRKVRLNGEEVTITKLRNNDDGTISARGTKIDADGKKVNTDWFLMEDAEVSDTSIFDEEGGAAEGEEPAEAAQPNEALTAMRERGLLSEDQTSLTVEGQEVNITDFRENENGEPEFKGTVTDAQGNVTETGWLDYTDTLAGEMGVTATPSRPRAQKKSIDKLQQELDDLVATRDSEDFKYTTDPQAKIDKLQSELDDLLKQRASTDLRFKKKKKGKYGSVRKRRSDAKVSADARALDKQIQKKRRELSEARKVVEAKGEQRLKTEEELIKTTRDINAAIKAKRAEIDNVSRGVDTTGGRKKAVDTPAPAPTVAIPAREEDLTAEKEVAMQVFADARKKLSEAPAAKKQEAELELFDAIKAIEDAGYKLTPAESKQVQAAKTRLKQKGYRTVKANKSNATVFEVIDDPKMAKDSETVEQVTPAITKNGKVVRRGKIRVTRGPVTGEKIAEQDVADKVAIAEVAGANVDTILEGIADDLSKNPNLTEEDLREERGLDQAVQDALRASAIAKDAIDPNKYPEKAKQNKARISKYRGMGYSYKGNVEAKDADIVEQLDDPDLKEGEQVVIELVEPQINKDGEVVSKAKVIVANGTGADGATAADYSPKTPQELRDAIEAEATRRAEEEAQALADLEAATAATGEGTGEEAGEAEITRIKSPGEMAAEDILKAISRLNSEDIINAIDALFVIDKIRGKVPSIALNNTQTRKIRAARERARVMGYSMESKTNQIAEEGDNVSTKTITNGSQLTEAQVRLLEAMPIGDPDGDVVIITETIKPTIKRDGLIERDAKYRGIRIPAKDVQRVINEARNAQRLANPRDKASVAFTLQQVFDLPVDQAEAAAEVIDSIVATMAARKSKQTGKTVTKEAIYDTIKWFKGLPEGFDGTKIPDSVRAAFIYKSEVEQIIAALTNPDVSSPLHEMAHVFERSLTTEEQKAVIEYAKKLGVQTEDKWTWKTSEVFAEGFERYLREGMAPSTKLAKIFDKFRTWIDTIASKIAGRDLSPRMREIYDTMLTEGDAFFEKAAKVVPETAKPTAGMVPKPALAAEPGDYVVFNGKNWFVASVTPDGLYKLVSENLRERATTNTIDAVLDLNLPSPETGDTIIIDGNEGVITVEKDKVIIKTADGELVYPNTLSVQKLISAGRRMQQMKEAADTAKAEAEAEALIPVDPEEKKRVEAINEIRSKRLTRVDQKNGTNMGAGKVMGKYASTEETNRYYDPEYTTEPYEVDAEVTNPYVVDDPNAFAEEWNRIINENFDSFDPLDFDPSNAPPAATAQYEIARLEAERDAEIRDAKGDVSSSTIMKDAQNEIGVLIEEKRKAIKAVEEEMEKTIPDNARKSAEEKALEAEWQNKIDEVREPQPMSLTKEGVVIQELQDEAGISLRAASLIVNRMKYDPFDQNTFSSRREVAATDVYLVSSGDKQIAVGATLLDGTSIVFVFDRNGRFKYERIKSRNTPTEGDIAKINEIKQKQIDAINEEYGRRLAEVRKKQADEKKASGQPEKVSTKTVEEWVKERRDKINEVNIEYERRISDVNSRAAQAITDQTRLAYDSAVAKINEKYARAIAAAREKAASRSNNITSENLSAAGLKRASKIVADDLAKRGYDSVYFRESEGQEGEIVVFDHNKLSRKNDNKIGSASYKNNRRNHKEGARVKNFRAGNMTFNARYKLIPASEAMASHNEQTFAKTEGFPTDAQGNTANSRNYEKESTDQASVIANAQAFTQQAATQTPVITKDGIIIDGNGRTMSRKRAAALGTDKEYKQYLRDNAHLYGFKPEDVDAFDDVMLVMETEDTPSVYDTELFANFNFSDKKEMSDAATGVAISKRMNDNDLIAFADLFSDVERMSDVTTDVEKVKQIKRILIDKGIITKEEIARFFRPDGMLTPSGTQMVISVGLGRIFDENAIYSLMSDGMGKTRQVVLANMPLLLSNSKSKGDSLIQNVNKAVVMLADMKKSGQTPDSMIGQLNIFDTLDMNPVDWAMVTLLRGDKASNESFKQFLNNYNRVVQGNEMFEKASQQEFIDKYLTDNISNYEAVRERLKGYESIAAERLRESDEDTRRRDILYQAVGTQAALEAPIRKALATALAFEARDRVASRQGKGDKDLKAKIRAATGWERGADGEWRYEIDPLRFKGDAWNVLPELKGVKNGSTTDVLMAVSNKNPLLKNLDEIVDPTHPIFKYYPQLANIKIFKGSLGDSIMGTYYDISPNPVIGISAKHTNPLSTIIHELAHAIQRIEGFAFGANSSVTAIQEIIDAMPSNVFADFRKTIEGDTKAIEAKFNQIADDLMALVGDAATLRQIEDLDQKIKGYEDSIADPAFAATRGGKFIKKMMNEEIKKREAVLEKALPLLDKKSINQVFKIGDANKILNDGDTKKIENFANYVRDQGRQRAISIRAGLPYGRSGFASAAGPDLRHNIYKRSAGEAEARNMQIRMNMTAEQRRATTLESTSDTPYKDQIIFFKDANGGVRFTEEAFIPQDIIDNQVHQVERSILFQQTEPQTPSPQLKEKMYEFADRWIRSTGSIAPSKFMRSVPASVKKLMTEEDITAIFEGTAAYAGMVEKRRLRAEGTAEARFGTEMRKSSVRMTARESTLDPSVKDRIRKERLRYFEEPMHHSEAQVDAWIREMGLDAATNEYLLDEAGSSLEGHLQVFLGIRLIRKLNEAGDFQRAADVAMKLAEVGTTLGRGVNAFKALATLTPDGLVAYMGKMMAKSESFLREKYRRRIDRSLEKYRQSKAKAADAATKGFFGNKEWVREAKNRLLEEIKNTSPSVLFQGTGIDPKIRPKIITFGMFLVMEGNNDFNKWSKKMQTQFKLTPLQTQEIWNEKYNAKDTIAGLASFNSFEADVRNNIEDLVALTAIFDNSSVYEASTLAKQVHNAYRSNIAKEFKKVANKAEQAFVQIIEAGNPLDATIIQKEYLKNGGFVGLDPELERQLKETARVLESAPTYAMKEASIQNLMRLAFKKMGTESIGQYLNAAMYFNMLGSPPTHLTNTIANIMQAAGDMFGDTVVAPLFNLPGIRLLTGSNKYMLYTPHRYFDNVKQSAAALKLGLKLGIANAKDIIRTGRLTQIQGQKYELPNLPERFSWGADVMGNLRVFSDQALKGDAAGAMQGLFRALTGAYFVAAKYNARVMDAEDAVVRVPVMVTYFTAAAEHIAAREVFQQGPKYQEKLAELQKNKIVVGDPNSKKNKQIIQDHITDDLRGWSSGKLTTRWKEKLKEVEDDLKASGLPYTKQDIINGAMERFPADFRVKDIAERRANRTVFRNKPEGTFGAIAEILNRGLRTFPPLAHVVPFTNILANVFNTWLDYIPPIAAARALGITGSTITNKMFNTSLPTTNIAGAGGFNRDIDEQIIRRNDLIFRGTLGMVAATVALIILGGEDEEGYPVLTGVGPSDFKKKEEEQSRGVMFGAVKIPGVGYVSYQNWPIGAVLAFIGNYYDIQRYGSQKEKDMALAATIAGFPAFVLEHNFLASLGEFFKTVSQSERYTTSEKIGSTISRALSKFIPFNAMLNNTEAALGLDKPELIGGWSLFRAIPFARQIASDKPVLDHFGRPVDKRIREGLLHNVSYHMVGAKRFYTPTMELDEVERIFLKKGYFTPRPSHTLKVGGVSLGEDPILEYDYILVSQRLFKKMADEIAPQYVDLPDDEFKKEMDRAHKEAKQVTKDLFLEGMTVDEMIEFLELPTYK